MAPARIAPVQPPEAPSRKRTAASANGSDNAEILDESPPKKRLRSTVERKAEPKPKTKSKAKSKSRAGSRLKTPQTQSNNDHDMTEAETRPEISRDTSTASKTTTRSKHWYEYTSGPSNSLEAQMQDIVDAAAADALKSGKGESSEAGTAPESNENNAPRRSGRIRRSPPTIDVSVGDVTGNKPVSKKPKKEAATVNETTQLKSQVTKAGTSIFTTTESTVPQNAAAPLDKNYLPVSTSNKGISAIPTTATESAAVPSTSTVSSGVFKAPLPKLNAKRSAANKKPFKSKLSEEIESYKMRPFSAINTDRARTSSPPPPKAKSKNGTRLVPAHETLSGRAEHKPSQGTKRKATSIIDDATDDESYHHHDERVSLEPSSKRYKRTSNYGSFRMTNLGSERLPDGSKSHMHFAQSSSRDHASATDVGATSTPDPYTDEDPYDPRGYAYANALPTAKFPMSLQPPESNVRGANNDEDAEVGLNAARVKVEREEYLARMRALYEATYGKKKKAARTKKPAAPRKSVAPRTTRSTANSGKTAAAVSAEPAARVPNSEYVLPKSFFPAQQPRKINYNAPWPHLSHHLPRTDIGGPIPSGKEGDEHHDEMALRQLTAIRDTWKWSHLSSDPANDDITATIDGLFEEFIAARAKFSRGNETRRNLGSKLRFDVTGPGVRFIEMLERTQVRGDATELLEFLRDWCVDAEQARGIVGDFVEICGKWRN